MLKFIIIAIILSFLYIIFAGLMKAAGKKTPSVPDIDPKENGDN